MERLTAPKTKGKKTMSVRNKTMEAMNKKTSVINSRKFLHYRIFDEYGNILPHGGVTVSYTPLANGTVDVGFSFCSPENRYENVSGRGKSISKAIHINKQRVSRENKHKIYSRKMTSKQLIKRADSIIGKKLKELQERHSHWNLPFGYHLDLSGI